MKTRWFTALTATCIVAALLGPAASAEPKRQPEVEIGEISYTSESDLEVAEVAAKEAASFDPSVVSDFDLLGRRGAIVRNIALRQLALDEAADELNEATKAHLASKTERRRAATELEHARDNLRAFAVDSYQLADSAALDPLAAGNEQARRGTTVRLVADDLMASVTDAQNELLDRLDQESAAELRREQARTKLARRQADQQRAIGILDGFEALVKIREETIKARIEATIAGEADGIVLFEVGGIRVAEEIAEQLELLLEAALADGIELKGGGYRSRASQIDLRRAHCGDSEYAIFEAPSSSCSPPTAPPGRSQHELGLAVDFTQNGSILTSSSSGFLWLQEHAEEYGFYNLPSEAWHWSTTGH